MSGYELTEEVKAEHLPNVQAFIEKIESENLDDGNDEPSVLELSDTTLNPYTLWKLLEDLGYEKDEMDDNGWQLDFWITMKRKGFKSLVIEGTGITFEFRLYANEARGMV